MLHKVKDLEISCDWRDFEKNVFDSADKYGVELIDTAPATLLDEYLLENTLYSDGIGFTLKGKRPRKYIIALSNYLNEWGSDMHVIFTDDEKKAAAVLERFKEVRERVNS